MESKHQRLAGKLVSENSPFKNSSFFLRILSFQSHRISEYVPISVFLMKDKCFQWQVRVLETIFNSEQTFVIFPSLVLNVDKNNF